MTLRYSFIIPIYNAETTLTQCVNSLLDQIRDSELLLINDGSTDGSAALCDALAAQHPSIRVFHTPNGGVSKARNLGIAQAKGERVIFFDADDYWISNSFEALDQYIQGFPTTDAVLFDYMVLDVLNGQMTDLDSDRGMRLDQPIDGKTFLDLALKQDPHFRVSACRWAVRREFIIENDLWFKEDLYFEDMLWVFQVILAAQSILYHPYPVYVYRQNQITSITGSLNAKKIQDRIWISGYWLNHPLAILTDPVVRSRFLRRTSELAFTSLIRYQSICTPSQAKSVLTSLKENKAFLKYPNSRMHTLLAKACLVFGISLTGSIYGCMFKIKNGMRRLIRL